MPLRPGQGAGECPHAKNASVKEEGAETSAYGERVEMAAKHSVQSSPNINNTNSAFQHRNTRTCVLAVLTDRIVIHKTAIHIHTHTPPNTHKHKHGGKKC